MRKEIATGKVESGRTPLPLVEKPRMGFLSMESSAREVASLSRRVSNTLGWLLAKQWIPECINEESANAVVESEKSQLRTALEMLILHPNFGLHTTEPMQERGRLLGYIDALHDRNDVTMRRVLTAIHDHAFAILVHHEATDQVRGNDNWKMNLRKMDVPPTPLQDSEKLPPHPVTIRPYQVQDYPAVARILLKACVEDDADYHRGKLKNPDHPKINKAVVAESAIHGKIVGAGRFQSLVNGVFLETITVDSAHQRQDVGTQIMQAIQNGDAHRYPKPWIYQSIGERNVAAQQFLAAQGFSATKFLQKGLKTADGLYRMEWRPEGNSKE